VKRRTFIKLLGGSALAWPFGARAQQKFARIGFLRQAGPHEKQFEAFREGLRTAGYVEGENIVIEQRYAAGAYDRLHALAMELVSENVDVIVVDGTAAAKACKGATATIPIVFALAVDPVIRAGRLRALAVTTATRSETLPGIPTMREFVPGYEASQWFGIGAPKNTPADIVDKLNREINAGLADLKIKARLADLGGEVLALSPADFGKLIADETEKWGKVIRAANIKAE
jgi:Tripartite tricarboxylate transporter family receptor/ABC transporter substrate binding protein